MSDRYYTFENFKYGLDSRKASLTEIPGTLQICTNAFVNSGGEVEQRKSFAQQFNSSHNDRRFPADTFGLQDTDSGLMTFGSDSAGAVGTLPPGITYQRLQHPSDPTTFAMTAVVFSCNFQGKPFVVARFADSHVYCFYNGSLITPSRNGLVLTILGSTETASNLGDDLVAIVNAMGPGWVATNNAGNVTVSCPAFVHFTPVPTVVSGASGQLGVQLLAQNGLGTSALAASVNFNLNAGTTGTVTVTAPAKSDGTGTAALTNGAVNFHTNLTQTATDIATAINNYTFVTGYSALSSGVNIVVYAPANWGNVTFNLTVTLTGDITTASGGSVTVPVVLSLTPRNVNVITTSSTPKTVRGSIQAQITGGVGAVMVAWAETNSDGSTPVTTPSGIAISNIGNVANVSFSKLLTLNTVVVGYFKCTATDTGPNTSTLYFSVTLELDSNA